MSETSSMNAGIPEYSAHLVALARAYDRASLASRANGWLIGDLHADAPEIFGTDPGISLSVWAEKRNDILGEILPDMLHALDALIQSESAPYFPVITDADGELIMPEQVANVLRPHMNEIYKDKEEVLNLCKRNESYLIDFEWDYFIIPKAIPRSFIEIWWRRWWHRSHPNGLYQLALVENPEYGWDCYGHER